MILMDKINKILDHALARYSSFTLHRNDLDIFARSFLLALCSRGQQAQHGGGNKMWESSSQLKGVEGRGGRGGPRARLYAPEKGQCSWQSGILTYLGRYIVDRSRSPEYNQ